MVPRTLATIAVGMFPPGLRICKELGLGHIIDFRTEVCETLEFAKDSTETALSGLSSQLDQAHAFSLEVTSSPTKTTLIAISVGIDLAVQIVREGLNIFPAHARLRTSAVLNSNIVSPHPAPKTTKVVLRLTVLLNMFVNFSPDRIRLIFSHGNVCRKHCKF